MVAMIQYVCKKNRKLFGSRSETAGAIYNEVDEETLLKERVCMHPHAPVPRDTALCAIMHGGTPIVNYS